MVLFIRHGLTSYDKGDERFAGWLPVPLDEKGMAQAQHTAQAVRKFKIQRLWSSDLVRSVQTAQEVAVTLEQVVDTIPALRSWDVGDWAGKPHEEAFPAVHKLIDTPSKKAPNGQSVNMFLDVYIPTIKPLIASKLLYGVVSHSHNANIIRSLCENKGKKSDPAILKEESPVKPGGVMLIKDDWTFEVFNSEAPYVESPKRAKKSAVLYMHVAGSDYQCKGCEHFGYNNRCELFGKSDVVKLYGTCGLFVPGEAKSKVEPMGLVTPSIAGYAENKPGFSCKRCEYFISERNDCQKVDPESEGPDPKEIHPDACCNAWEKK